MLNIPDLPQRISLTGVITMVRLIMGTKGSGKTKQLIELINNAATLN